MQEPWMSMMQNLTEVDLGNTPWRRSSEGDPHYRLRRPRTIRRHILRYKNYLQSERFPRQDLCTHR